MNVKPTEAQVKRFWEWCGFIYVPTGGVASPEQQEAGEPFVASDEPKITLDNLFKYAVPKAREEHNELRLLFNFGSCNYCAIYSWGKKYSRKKNFEWLKMGDRTDDDPALALFWAILGVIDK